MRVRTATVQPPFPGRRVKPLLKTKYPDAKTKHANCSGRTRRYKYPPTTHVQSTSASVTLSSSASNENRGQGRPWKRRRIIIHKYIHSMEQKVCHRGCGTSYKYTNIHNFYSVKYYKHEGHNKLYNSKGINSLFQCITEMNSMFLISVQQTS